MAGVTASPVCATRARHPLHSLSPNREADILPLQQPDDEAGETQSIQPYLGCHTNVVSPAWTGRIFDDSNQGSNQSKAVDTLPKRKESSLSDNDLAQPKRARAESLSTQRSTGFDGSTSTSTPSSMTGPKVDSPDGGHQLRPSTWVASNVGTRIKFRRVSCEELQDNDQGEDMPVSLAISTSSTPDISPAALTPLPLHTTSTVFPQDQPYRDLLKSAMHRAFDSLEMLCKADQQVTAERKASAQAINDHETAQAHVESERDAAKAKLEDALARTTQMEKLLEAKEIASKITQADLAKAGEERDRAMGRASVMEQEVERAKQEAAALHQNLAENHKGREASEAKLVKLAEELADASTEAGHLRRCDGRLRAEQARTQRENEKLKSEKGEADATIVLLRREKDQAVQEMDTAHAQKLQAVKEMGEMGIQRDKAVKECRSAKVAGSLAIVGKNTATEERDQAVTAMKIAQDEVARERAEAAATLQGLRSLREIDLEAKLVAELEAEEEKGKREQAESRVEGVKQRLIKARLELVLLKG